MRKVDATNPVYKEIMRGYITSIKMTTTLLKKKYFLEWNGRPVKFISSNELYN